MFLSLTNVKISNKDFNWEKKGNVSYLLRTIYKNYTDMRE
jgi:hypothetical protein